MKIVVIDNGGQYCHRICRTIQNIAPPEFNIEILPNTTPLEELDADGIAFSGSGILLSENIDPMGNCATYLDNFNGPILGMCAGHHLIATHFGGETSPAQNPEFGKMEIIVDNHDEILKGLPDKFIGWVSHNDEVSAIPNCLEVLAHSESCKYEAIKHKKNPIFGLQFHPEVQHTEFGSEIFKNFIEIVLSYKKSI